LDVTARRVEPGEVEFYDVANVRDRVRTMRRQSSRDAGPHERRRVAGGLQEQRGYQGCNHAGTLFGVVRRGKRRGIDAPRRALYRSRFTLRDDMRTEDTEQGATRTDGDTDTRKDRAIVIERLHDDARTPRRA